MLVLDHREGDIRVGHPINQVLFELLFLVSWRWELGLFAGLSLKEHVNWGISFACSTGWRERLAIFEYKVLAVEMLRRGGGCFSITNLVY